MCFFSQIHTVVQGRKPDMLLLKGLPVLLVLYCPSCEAFVNAQFHWHPGGGGRSLWGETDIPQETGRVFQAADISCKQDLSFPGSVFDLNCHHPGSGFKNLIVTLFNALSNTSFFLMLLRLIKLTSPAAEEQLCVYFFLSEWKSLVEKEGQIKRISFFFFKTEKSVWPLCEYLIGLFSGSPLRLLPVCGVDLSEGNLWPLINAVIGIV